MGRPPLKSAMEMAPDLAQRAKTNEKASRMYKTSGTTKELSDAYRGGEIARAVKLKKNVLQQIANRERIDLNNLQAVRERTVEYFNGCELAQVFPSIGGLAVEGFGLPRRLMDLFLQNHSDSASAQYIYMVKDMIGDVLADSALKNQCNSIFAIFAMKNLGSGSAWVDKYELEGSVPHNPLGESGNPEEIKARLVDAIDD